MGHHFPSLTCAQPRSGMEMWDSFATVDVEISGVVPAPPHAVWAHLSTFGDLGECMTPVNGLAVRTSLLAGYSEKHVGARRMLQIGSGRLVEELTALDHECQTLAFKLVSDPQNVNPFPASFLNHKCVIKQRTVTTTNQTFIEIAGRFLTEHPMVGIMADTCECLYEAIIHGLTERLGGAYLQAADRVDSFYLQSPKVKPQDPAQVGQLPSDAPFNAARLSAHSMGRRSGDLALPTRSSEPSLLQHSYDVINSLRSSRSMTRPSAYTFDVARGTPSLRAVAAPIGAGYSPDPPGYSHTPPGYCKDSPPAAVPPAFPGAHRYTGYGNSIPHNPPAHSAPTQSGSGFGASCLSKLQSLHVGLAGEAEPSCVAERHAGGRPHSSMQDRGDPSVHTPKQKVEGPPLAAPWSRHPSDSKAASRCSGDPRRGGLAYA